MEKSLTQYARDEIKDIHELSRRYNGGAGREHARVLLEMIKKHARELEELYLRDDGHFTVEAGDLAVLCHELILEQEKDPDGILEVCYKRFREKLTGLIKEREVRGKE